MDTTKDGVNENSHRDIEPLKDSEEMIVEGKPCEVREFWFQGAEFVDIENFFERL